MTLERLYARVMEWHTYLAKNQGFEGSNPSSCTTFKRKEIKMKIYKFLSFDSHGIQIPICKPLSIKLSMDGIHPVFYALVPSNTEEKTIKAWEVKKFETGSTIDDGGIYIGTIVDSWNNKVYHYFFYSYDEDFDEPFDEAYEGDSANYELSW